ncbi:MAG: dipicolinate synthase subunit B [Lachnospiraceae bacterium]|nr:dipicolinate synthase subunit B [Lachnospiraceae bacterium]MDE5781432.1 dipicolinate synthase subunit B [Lachnospiraceae bacterium]MDE6234098.1 dipicolinate synthase subunit B [Lachnospiraceae bacterium]MDE6254252.1 dipicolinate synthase subunit B [Lachnospiraceae bacterium]
MLLEGKKIGIAITGSFCTFENILKEIELLVKEEKAEVYTIFSEMSKNTDTRFGAADKFFANIEKITGNKPITTIVGAEPIGPNPFLDVLAIFPCTGNTMAKLANGITDTPVLMAAKAHLRNEKPLVISISTNDALGMNMKNIGELMNVKNIFFVPFGQDNHIKKPNSMIARTEMLVPVIEAALEKKQYQPVIMGPK